MLAHLLHSDTVKEIAEARPLTVKVPLEGPDIRPHRISNPSESRPAFGHEQPDRLFDFPDDSPFARVDGRSNEPSGVTGKRGIPVRALALHVPRVDQDPVEIRPELDWAIEEALIDRSVSQHRPLVTEDDALGPPVVPHHRAAQIVVHAKRRVVDLT